MDEGVTSPARAGLDLHVELGGEGGTRAALMRALREAVRAGRLAPGARLPSYRSLAVDLGIARNTVAGAYAELIAEGWLVARRGSGTRVAPRAVAPAAERARPAPAGGAARRAHDLMPGRPDPASFPRAAWLAAARRALAAAPSQAFGPGEPRGQLPLRRELADYLARARGVHADAGRIVICSGVDQALRLLAAARPTSLAVEGYALFTQRQRWAEAGAPTVPLEVDEGGARVADLAATGARTALLTPAHQFPMGVALHPERRAAVIDWARATDGLLIEDDYDGEYRYDRQPVGAVQGLDPERVAYVGSVSKSLSPGLRLGWMVLPEWLVADVLRVKGGWELTVGCVDQLTLAELLGSGVYDRHVRQSRQRYRQRRDRLVAALAERAPEVAVSGIAAGLHALLRLPPGDEEAVVRRAARRGIGLVGLAAYRHPDYRGPAVEGLVVGYGAPPEHAFPAALDALCRLFPAPGR
ncbi:PLP-dependent aminotransferase family protein [Streptomyces profundus]|uniref:MocR-like pyridoxine biosynthesis transcription factor PdxR n=1 Tax=Streptomyces profundus TaxID=2867410 RepID=UPI001D15F8C1|nr:PLP-dependent aminotransferase family protein [Streptomyces sp. MA3_2.13]